jgi:hypothetical protein
VANIEKAQGVITTEAGEQEVMFQGAVGFRVLYGREGVEDLRLIRLNLHTPGVKGEEGETGTIGLMLAEPEYKTGYDPGSGQVETGFHFTLHYPLIDERMGFRGIDEAQGDTCFAPYLETMEGRLSGQLPEDLHPDDEGRYILKLEISAEIMEAHVRSIHQVYLVIMVPLIWLFSAAEILRIQPVFIGTGPTDPTATGTIFRDLALKAGDMWNRCGTERCLGFTYNAPIYVNKDQYRVISSDNELWNFSNEVTVANAVEIFFAERFTESYAVATGGGGTYSSGTATARIVTCDQQLDVPCPAPCGYGFCGPVNHYHLAHELGHVLNLDHPSGQYGLAASTANSVMEGSGWCLDNPNAQSAKNCRNASNPLLFWGQNLCWGSPDIND